MASEVWYDKDYSYVKEPWIGFRHEGDKKSGMLLKNAKLYVALIEAETALRTSVQREEYIKHSIRASEEGSSEPSPVPTTERQRELLKIQEKLPILQQTLYEAEWAFPHSIRTRYRSVTKDPSWYLRSELVNYCVKKGGCCSRECGCCEKRQFSSERNFGVGHCTSYCACCDVARGGEITDECRKSMEESFTRMLKSDEPGFLGLMLLAYFTVQFKVKPKVEDKKVQDKESDTKESDAKEACIKVEARELDAESSRSGKKAGSKRSPFSKIFHSRNI
ncbi:hypothetical protein N7466_007379 [Penicillium verhagenii]|uniref:uncharacterized protein n=1 Tax=Penicillium verhagenii TaxID=1562060 RepID=UPI002545B538|nr:uncharacterized protein N7466_007379 [Penicillium verhagenii]KAJ5928423.1 hypothetical protein N7466_007379 [Penicillium verhagenii]